jgi:hypothetical protein
MPSIHVHFGLKKCECTVIIGLDEENIMAMKTPSCKRILRKKLMGRSSTEV